MICRWERNCAGRTWVVSHDAVRCEFCISPATTPPTTTASSPRWRRPSTRSLTCAWSGAGTSSKNARLPPEIEIVQWSGGKAPARWQDGLAPAGRAEAGASDGSSRDLYPAGPIQRSAFLAALAGFQPAGEHVLGLRPAAGCQAQCRLGLGHPLHPETQRRHGRRLQYHPPAGRFLWHAGRADRHLSLGHRPGAFHTRRQRTATRG